MAQVRWTPQAADDLESIADFISQDSGQYARLFVINILSAVERLAGFPLLGRMVPGVRDTNVRELILGNYRIVYRVGRDLVVILTIFHGARILDPRTLD
jgi:addiction module RelE/StbE family toxin